MTLTLKEVLGNKPFLKSYNNSFLNITFPPLHKIQNALNEAGLGDKIKIVQFLSKNGVPFTMNIYPFLSLYGNDDFPFNYAFFDGVDNPENDNGWPTEGDKNANTGNALRFYNGLLPRLAANRGTPRRPGYIEVYLFGFIDEDAKSIAPGNLERHWGTFRYDGQPKFPMDLSGQNQNKFLVGTQNVNYLAHRWCMFNPDAKDLSKLPDNTNYACTFGLHGAWIRLFLQQFGFEWERLLCV
ncbi:Glucan endo-1,3-beta-glucosidase 8 [Glycine max]|nr:Glucan endo-1,3-beta-glucosidase 8 [Glycine max]